jgi:hypothetical protein
MNLIYAVLAMIFADGLRRWHRENEQRRARERRRLAAPIILACRHSGAKPEDK